MSGSPAVAAGARRERPPAAAYAVLFVAFLAVGLLVYRPALEGRFMSDDVPHLLMNPYVQELSLENVLAILHPFGPPVAYTANYSPVHLLVHALGVSLWGNDVRAFHVLNVAVHALCAVLLAGLLMASRLPLSVAALGAAIFLLHPANVEAVALIFQLKTLLSTAFAFGALLVLSRRPALATVLFALGLLTKITAGFAWPVAAAWALARSARGRDEPARVGWLVAWGVIAVAVAIPELAAGQRGGEHMARVEELGLQLRTIFAIVARYLVMATTTLGLSAFHQPDPARSWADPWWLGGLAAVLLIAARTGLALRRRREEAGYWILAAASFAPISQVLPFLFPMADRYLYAILPGLLGGALLAGRDLGGPAAARLRSGLPPAALPAAATRALALGLSALLLLGLAVRSEARTWIYRTEANLRRDSAANYPDGLHGHLLRAELAADSGDGAGVAEGLRRAYERGYVAFLDLVDGRGSLAAYRHRPGVEAVLREMAAWWIEREAKIDRLAQIDLYMIGRAHEVRGEPERALRSLERALALGGPHDEVLRRHMARLGEHEAGSGSGDAPLPERERQGPEHGVRERSGAEGRGGPRESG